MIEQNGGARVPFLHWMAIGMPMVIVLLPIAAWILLTFHPHDDRAAGGTAVMHLRLRQKGGGPRIEHGHRRVPRDAAIAAAVSSPILLLVSLCHIAGFRPETTHDATRRPRAGNPAFASYPPAAAAIKGLCPRRS